MFAVVVDTKGYKVEFVVLNGDKSLQFYELKEGESVVEQDWEIANSMNKPQWTGSEWIDTDPLPPVVPEPPEPNKMEVLRQEVEELKASQMNQDMIIDDVIFEVIPTIEEEISANHAQPIQLASAMLNKLLKNKGESAMAGYLARKIMDGRDYASVFRIYSYKQYQDEVDTILELEGRSDLIKR